MRLLQWFLASAVAAIASLGTASAQDYPNRAIRFVVPFAAGGPTDIGGRILAREMSLDLGVPITVDNRPGATGVIGMEALTASPPDGYTVLLLPNATTVALHAQNKPLDIDTRFTVVGGTIIQPMLVVVNPKVVDVRNLRELDAYFKANPGTLYTTSGPGSPSHVAMEVLAKRRGLNLTHVAYKGINPALMDVVAGRVGVFLTDAGASRPHVQSGALRPIAAGGSVRSTMYPNIETAGEQGFTDLEYDGINALIVPPGTPAPILQRLRTALKKAVESETHTRFATDAGNKALYTDGPAFRDVLQKDFDRWGRLIREAGDLTSKP